MPNTPIADDQLNGRGEIAIEYFGENTPKTRRKVGYLINELNPPEARIPVFRYGSGRSIKASRTQVRAHYAKYSGMQKGAD
jgi:hypothetical protein